MKMRRALKVDDPFGSNGLLVQDRNFEKRYSAFQTPPPDMDSPLQTKYDPDTDSIIIPYIEQDTGEFKERTVSWEQRVRKLVAPACSRIAERFRTELRARPSRESALHIYNHDTSRLKEILTAIDDASHVHGHEFVRDEILTTLNLIEDYASFLKSKDADSGESNASRTKPRALTDSDGRRKWTNSQKEWAIATWLHLLKTVSEPKLIVYDTQFFKMFREEFPGKEAPSLRTLERWI